MVRHACCWGRHEFLVEPGSHTISVSYRRLLCGWGKSVIEVDVMPGEVKDITYSASLARFRSGELKLGSPFVPEGWLRQLRAYVSTKQKLLDQGGFTEISSRDGPGMGAIIAYSNEAMGFELVNDKGQFFVYMLPDLPAKYSCDLSFVIAVSRLIQRGTHFADLTEEQKHELYCIDIGLEDPLAALMANYDGLALAVDEQHLDDTVRELGHFLEGIRGWRP